MEKGLEAYNLLVGFNTLCVMSDRDRSYWDEGCDFFAMASEDSFVEPGQELDDIGIYLGIDGGELSDLYSAELHLDGGKFMQHYFPDLPEATSRGEREIIQSRSEDFQNHLDEPRRNLFNFYGHKRLKP